jgi:medium-chain acyl-[acyl-carrier-protein] hydrolase
MSINLICLPFAGGSKYSYNLYTKYKPPFIDLTALDYPGHGARLQERLLTDIQSIADDVYEQIKHKLHTPYAIYGHSMGALVAYLTVRKILEEQQPLPAHLFLTGCGSPSSNGKRRGRHLLSSDSFIEELKSMGGIPDEILYDSDSMRFFEPKLRADFQAVDTYHYAAQPAFELPVTVITGLQEIITIEEALQWQEITNQPLSFKQLPGGHFFIFNCANEVMGIIEQSLAAMLV